MGSFKILREIRPCQWQNTVNEFSSLVKPYSLQFLGEGLGARLATDWVASCSLHHVCWMCTWQQLTCTGPEVSLDGVFPSKSLLGWLSHFLSLISPLEGIWSLECLWCFLLSMPKPPQEMIDSLKPVQMGFKSEWLPSCCVSLTSLWCLSSMVPCMPHPVPSMWQVFITIGLVWKLTWKIFVELPLPITRVFPFSRSTSFHLLYHWTHLLDMRKFPYTVKKKTNQRDKNMFL